eukprot:scaffold6821_cov159-Ochromonas_danica.AAC.3
MTDKQTTYLIAVVRRLVRTLHRDANVVSLVLGKSGELHAERAEVESGHLLIEVLGEDVDLATLVLVRSLVGPEFDLSQGL